MKIRSLLFLSWIAALPGCGSSNTNPTADAAVNGADASANQPDAFVPPLGSFTLQWGPLNIDPGVENTRCVTKRLGNPEQLRVNMMHNVLGGLSHHLIVYRVSDEVEQPEPYDCDPFTDTLDPTQGSPLMVTQKFEEVLTLPDGVAFTLQPNQMIRIEMHYINASEEVQEALATTTFSPIPEEQYQHEADFLFIGNPDIDLGPGPNTLGPTYFPLPTDLADVSFFAITGHEHQWGTDVRVAITDPNGGPDTDVYKLDNFSWSEPETVYHDPPFQIPAGAGFRFTCEWNNQSGGNVGFGESAGDEMCFFWAYYYPSKGAKVCVHTDQVGSLNVCCPGDALCDFLPF